LLGVDSIKRSSTTRSVKYFGVKQLPIHRTIPTVQALPLSGYQERLAKMKCFCDIPVDNLSIHIKKYSPFGLSFYKNFIVQNGGCPVFYIPLKGKVATNIQKADYFDNMLKEYHSLCGYLEDLMKKHDHRPAFGLPQNFKRFYELQRFLAHQLFSYIKFFEHTLHEEHPDNYYFEREWRIIGQLKFKPEDIKTIFMPYEYTNRFKKDFPEYKGAIFQL